MRETSRGAFWEPAITHTTLEKDGSLVIPKQLGNYKFRSIIKHTAQNGLRRPVYVRDASLRVRPRKFPASGPGSISLELARACRHGGGVHSIISV